MSKGDTARMHYESARSELIQRIQLRDNTLVLFLGAVGAIIGFLGSSGQAAEKPEVLLIIPFLAFGTATIAEHHGSMIGLLALFLSVELGTFFKDINEQAPQWDASHSLLARELKIGRSRKGLDLKRPLLLRRKIGHWILLLTPSVLSLIINFKYSWPINQSYWSLAWWFALLLTGLTFTTVRQSDAFRLKLYSYIKQNEGLDK